MSNVTEPSTSLALATAYLNQRVQVQIDRPLGSAHPIHGFIYTVNYGYVPDTRAPDGEELDAYLLGPTDPVRAAEGTCVAIIHRIGDDDDKLVVVNDHHLDLSDQEILAAVAFQEQEGCHQLIR